MDWIAKCDGLYITGMCASDILADNQGTIVCTSSPCVDGKGNVALLQAEDYTVAGMADNQSTIDGARNQCVDGDTDDALCCKPRAECSSLYTTGMCASNGLDRQVQQPLHHRDVCI